MTSTRYFFLFLCLAVLSSMALTQGVLISKYLQLQATPLWVKLSPRDDSRDTVLRRVKRPNQRIYLYFKTESLGCLPNPINLSMKFSPNGRPPPLAAPYRSAKSSDASPRDREETWFANQDLGSTEDPGRVEDWWMVKGWISLRRGEVHC
ncbi:hypothetical protein JTE90_017436 [Oedothorax gibbosus]|uniref:Uncharacterized protein n=1 Tax=Oedothorax gibbosus TaxID=931172 RepID=A0AAV6TTT6_9ARAC|nr:hypothetical protein JTE90_017436 [Oedothorax gibbosus]